MTAVIQTLIQQPSQVRVIRDQIAAALLLESIGQQALAAADGQDPALWKLHVFVDRANPWDEFSEDDESPIINVSFDTKSIDGNAGNGITRHKSSAVYNIDCYGTGVSCATAEGHDPGDYLAATEAMRCFELAEQILMSGYYVYLRMRGIVGKRAIQSVTAFQPQLESRPARHVNAIRISFAVDFTETTTEYQPETMELLSTRIVRASDGQILALADFEATPDS